MLKSAQYDHRKETRTVNFWINMRIVYGKVFANFLKYQGTMTKYFKFRYNPTAGNITFAF